MLIVIFFIVRCVIVLGYHWMKLTGLVSLESSKHMITFSLWLANPTKSKAVQALNNIFIDAWYADPPPPPDAGAVADGSAEDVEDSYI